MIINFKYIDVEIPTKVTNKGESRCMYTPSLWGESKTFAYSQN